MRLESRRSIHRDDTKAASGVLAIRSRKRTRTVPPVLRFRGHFRRSCGVAGGSGKRTLAQNCEAWVGRFKTGTLICQLNIAPLSPTLVNYLLYWMSACNTGGACRNSPFMQDRSPATTATAAAALLRISSLSSSSASKWTGRNQWGRKGDAKKATRCVRLKFNIRKLRFFYILRFFVSRVGVLVPVLFVPLPLR